MTTDSQRDVVLITGGSEGIGLALAARFLAEGNTCFHGGKHGVSDTFASALWSGDYML
jgi:NAD(P)-dependent dehydrogenase (short-subunit alcohol dehydrogenase family)